VCATPAAIVSDAIEMDLSPGPGGPHSNQCHGPMRRSAVRGMDGAGVRASCPSSDTSLLLGKLQLQGSDLERVPHLCIVERRQTELVGAIEIVELHVVLAAGHELA
jgi:hypothetical protein